MMQDILGWFAGDLEKHGTFRDTEMDGPKQKGVGRTVVGPPPDALVSGHELGEGPRLGCFLLDSDSRVRVGIIDVDDYEISIMEMAAMLQGSEWTVVESKSGGLHIMVFFTKPAPAKDVVARLKEEAVRLGVAAKSEYWPKQTKYSDDPQRKGNWYILPYFGDRCWAVVQGRRLKPVDFVDRIKRTAVDPDVWLGSSQEQSQIPPCLECLMREKQGLGGRNTFLFNVAVLEKKRNPKDWQERVRKANDDYCSPVVTLNEVRQIVESAKASNSFYTCDKAPLVSRCAKEICKSRKFGIGNTEDNLPVITGMSKIDAEPPFWIAHFEDGRSLQLSAEDLQIPSRFQRAMMSQLNKMPKMPKAPKFLERIAPLVESAIIVEVPQETKEPGLLWEYMHEYFRRAVEDETVLLREGVLMTAKSFYFKPKPFIDFLVAKRFVTPSNRNRIYYWLREFGVTEIRRRMKTGDRVRVLEIDRRKLDIMPDVVAREDEESVI